MTTPRLLLLGHGSRDPRHAATMDALVARLRAQHPGLDARVGYLDHCAPRIPRALEQLAEEEDGPVVAVPMLLARAYHAKTDIPGVLREAAARLPRLTVHQADVLGPSPLLWRALERRLAEVGVQPSADTGIILASAGSSDPAANAATRATAAAWQRAAGWGGVAVAHASAAPPSVADAAAALRARGLRRLAVAPYLLAPGLLPDRIADQAATAGIPAVAAPIGASPDLAELLMQRYAEALTIRPEQLAVGA
ncbi:sirohydrochlorin chelatase [Streptacidiphilus jiangxiensis]|uniref:Sirohydrochlorin ferrochelatase n=1 Tax=Streptacidiphilus jiangxiensis TaxID=235985 RepID=A0A1H7SHD6_STRJI|nr:sirohydrochlorin chelatase [Streptacidiphilus jiangxiensis]SEL71769.1 Sirohydrochlorin ferrochelatase [Streptacidiphilus jiangxiensis]